MIYAIIVTYHPNMAMLLRLLQVLQPQVDHIIVVDNTSSEEGAINKLLTSLPSSSLINNDSNKGMAEAINLGVRAAREKSASHVVFFDQDSMPATNMVGELLNTFNLKQLEGVKIAAAGPCYSDIKGGASSPFVRIDGLRLRRVECAGGGVVEVDHLITSGCLVSLHALADIGDMDSNLFIDYVDTEWCLRARSKRYQLFGVGSAKMQHDIGDSQINFMGRNLSVHRPFRYYYLIRNGVWLLGQPWVSFQWRVLDIRRLFLIYVTYSLFLGDRFNNWKMMTRGIWHGLTGKMGKLKDS